MQDEKLSMFRNRLVKVYRHLGKQAKRLQVSCYRLYDHDLPEFPLCIEFYEDRLYLAEYKRRHGMTDEEHDAWMEKTIDVILEVLPVQRDNIYLKLRQRKPGRLGQYQKTGAEQHEFVVTENGLRFIVNLSDYLDTGLFLDHRITRQLVREQSEGKRVLNLFAYTGSFSVYAAAGKASGRCFDIWRRVLESYILNGGGMLVSRHQVGGDHSRRTDGTPESDIILCRKSGDETAFRHA